MKSFIFFSFCLFINSNTLAQSLRPKIYINSSYHSTIVVKQATQFNHLCKTLRQELQTKVLCNSKQSISKDSIQLNITEHNKGLMRVEIIDSFSKNPVSPYVSMDVKDPSKLTALLLRPLHFRVNRVAIEEELTKKLTNNGKREIKAKEKKYLLAIINVGALLGVATTNYWIDVETNAEDFEYRFDWESYRKKTITMEGVRFDSNSIELNMGHAFAGHLYYLAARENGFSPGQSFLTALIASTFWEYFSEFKEKVSINDMVITPLGGKILGEAVHQTTLMLESKSDIFSRILAAAINPAKTINRLIKERKLLISKSDVAKYSEIDSDYFPEGHAEIWAGGRASAKNLEQKVGVFGATAKTYKSKRNLKFGEQTRIELEAALGEDGLERLRYYFQTLYIGKTLGKIKSNSITFSFDGEVEYTNERVDPIFDNSSQRKDHRNIMAGRVNFIGTRVQGKVIFKGIVLQAELYTNTGMLLIRPLALFDLENDPSYNFEETKTVVDNSRYYYAINIFNGARISGDFGPVSIEASADIMNSWSIQGISRYQENVINDAPWKDFVTRQQVRAIIRLFETPAHFFVRARAQQGHGEHQSYTEKYELVEIMLGVLARF